jgi:hypothetical protein
MHDDDEKVCKLGDLVHTMLQEGLSGFWCCLPRLICLRAGDEHTRLPERSNDYNMLSTNTLDSWSISTITICCHYFLLLVYKILLSIHFIEPM